MKKLCIIIGHGGNDCGAINPHTKETELAYNTELADMLMEALKNEYEVVKYNRGYNKVENVGIVNGYKSDLILSLHCNSFNGIASGTEALYWYSSEKSKKLAEILSKNISETFGIHNRGAKPRVTNEIKKRNPIKFKDMETRGSYLLYKTNAPCNIIEPFFIDNDGDLRIGKEKKREYVEAIKKSIKEYFEGVM